MPRAPALHEHVLVALVRTCVALEAAGFPDPAGPGLSFGALRFRARWLADRASERTFEASLAARAGAADEDGWRRWCKRQD